MKPPARQTQEVIRLLPQSSSPNANRAERVAAIVETLAEAFRAKVSPLTIRAYFVGTFDLTLEAIEDAAMRAITESQFMPTVRELRILAGILMPEARAAAAWDILRRVIPHVGIYKSVNFDDPIINATVFSIGGWVRICETPSGDKFDVWLRKRFEEKYVQLLATGVTVEMAAPLHGLDAITNHATGYDEWIKPPQLVETNLPPHARQLVLERPKGIGQAIRYLTESIQGTD